MSDLAKKIKEFYDLTPYAEVDNAVHVLEKLVTFLELNEVTGIPKRMEEGDKYWCACHVSYKWATCTCFKKSPSKPRGVSKP